MKDIKILAILVGAVTDVGSTQVILMKFVFLSAFVGRIQGQDIQAMLLHPPLSVRIPEMVLGALGSFLGGFVTARMAKTAEIKNTLLMGIVSDASATLLFGTKVEQWILMIGSALTPVSAMLGGWLSLAIRREEK